MKKKHMLGNAPMATIIEDNPLVWYYCRLRRLPQPTLFGGAFCYIFVFRCTGTSPHVGVSKATLTDILVSIAWITSYGVKPRIQLERMI